MLNYTDAAGIELHHYGDLPARSGMGSSSAFANALILALTTLRGEQLETPQLFRQALELEQSRLRENVGSQDQVATAVGGFNVIHFHPDDSIEVIPVQAGRVRVTQLEGRLMLFFTGMNRIASEIAGKVIASIADRGTELRAMRGMVDDALDLLQSDGDLDQFGTMLHETWLRKRSLCVGITNEAIDRIYDKARSAGALGGKLLGAGAAGFMVFYVPPDRQEAVRRALDFLLYVPFQFEFDGATILYNSVLRPNVTVG